MSQPLINNNFGRHANGDPFVQYHLWNPYGIDEVEWRDLTNEEIIVAVSHFMIVAVVLQDKTQHTELKNDEPGKIKELFDILHTYNDPNFDYKIFLLSTYIEDNGELRVSQRSRKIDAELSKHMDAVLIHRQAQELSTTYERFVTAKSCGVEGDHPVVVGGYVRLPNVRVVDHSLGYPGPSFE